MQPETQYWGWGTIKSEMHFTHYFLVIPVFKVVLPVGAAKKVDNLVLCYYDM
jgi:hypothetical protein